MFLLDIQHTFMQDISRVYLLSLGYESCFEDHIFNLLMLRIITSIKTFKKKKGMNYKVPIKCTGIFLDM